MTYRKYFLIWSVITLIGLAGSAAINIVVDPYGMFEVVRLDGFNEIKPAGATRIRTAKIYQVMNSKPATLIVGNSRPEMGLDPDHACWKENHTPVFNIAVPGISLYRQFRYAQHAISTGEVSTLYLGLDILDFMTDLEERAQPPASWPDPRFETRSWRVDIHGNPDPGYTLQRLKDASAAAFSIKALSASVETVLSQDDLSAPSRTRSGYNIGERTYREVIQTEGIDVLFHQKNQSLARRMQSKQYSLYNNDGSLARSFMFLENFLDYTKTHNIRVVAFLNPYHGEYFTLLSQAGLWQDYLQWRIEVAKIFQEKLDQPIWDFSEISPYTTEPMQELWQEKKTLKWFWEPSHYRKELGDLMIKRMVGSQCDTPVSEDFGFLLTPENADARNRQFSSQLEKYLGNNPDVHARIRSLFAGSGS